MLLYEYKHNFHHQRLLNIYPVQFYKNNNVHLFELQVSHNDHHSDNFSKFYNYNDPDLHKDNFQYSDHKDLHLLLFQMHNIYEEMYN